ncbi:hypothetical protein HA066_26200, partial [Escherichia coli]|nr:hypothetical protein [Escherichia coli]
HARLPLRLDSPGRQQQDPASLRRHLLTHAGLDDGAGHTARFSAPVTTERLAMLCIGVDIGGTFTDVIVYEPATARLAEAKT